MASTKKVKTVIKINIKAGEATPAPPIGTALGPHGVNIMDFVKSYNDKTSSMKGNIVPAVITIYEDRTFSFEIKMAPASELIKKKLGLEKGSGIPNRQPVGKLTQMQLEEIAREKMADLNTDDIVEAKKIIAGTARSMGVKIE